MRFVPAGSLQPGMILDEEVIRMDGHAVIIHYKKGNVLTQEMCDTIVRLGFDTIMIYDDRFNRIIPHTTLSVELRESVYGLLNALFIKIQKTPKKVTRDDFTALYPHIQDMAYEFRTISSFYPLTSLKRETEYIVDHAINTAVLAGGIGKKLRFSADMLEKTIFAALLHDIGMLFVPKMLYSDRKILTEHEKIELARHTELGFEYVQSFNLSGIGSLAAYTVLRHHERIDGSGYPGGRNHTDINKAAQVCGIADFYCALISERPYRKAFTKYDAVKMYIERNTAFSTDIRNACMTTVIIFPNGSTVQLSTKEKAVVLSQTDDPFKPIVGIPTIDTTIVEIDMRYDPKRRIYDCSV